MVSYLGWQRAKTLTLRLRYLELAELAEVPRYLARYLGWQQAKMLVFRLRYLELAELAELAKVPRYTWLGTWDGNEQKSWDADFHTWSWLS